mmetsp:Transcript_25017/g.75103  ORF Transcript_25017/g.75103 Transcript_25017/m.75103 type:complete len:131 (-) Transcript_25017:19-411(-)
MADEPAAEEPPLRVLGEAEDEGARTFVFKDEDHTLGNALRHVLMRHPDTDFCGYSVPHPSEPYMNVRLQTRGRPAVEVLDAGLGQLGSICDALTAQLDREEAAATTRKRSDSHASEFIGPGKHKPKPDKK